MRLPCPTDQPAKATTSAKMDMPMNIAGMSGM
jgi:hypothetical protein